jgi:hypothetical protein
MEDYSRYLNAIQSAGYADSVADMKRQIGEQKQEALQPLGEMLTTGGVTHGASSAYGAIKDMVVEKAKDVARATMKKYGVSDDDAEQLLKGNFDKLAKSKVQDLIDKAKTKADDIKTSVEDKVSEVKSQAQDTLDEAKATVQDTVDEVQGMVPNVSDLDVVDGGNIAGDLANEENDSLSSTLRGVLGRFSQPEQEFGDDDLLQFPRMLQQSGGIRPQPTEAPMIEEGTEMADMTGYVNQAQSVAENTLSQVGEFADSALSTATTTAESIAPALSDAVGSVSTALTGVASSITETASGITSAVSNAVSGVSSALSGATAGATAGEVTAEAVGSSILEGASAFLGPLGVLTAIGGGIASLVEGLEPHEQAPVLNPSAQFL